MGEKVQVNRWRIVEKGGLVVHAKRKNIGIRSRVKTGKVNGSEKNDIAIDRIEAPKKKENGGKGSGCKRKPNEEMEETRKRQNRDNHIKKKQSDVGACNMDKFKGI